MGSAALQGEWWGARAREWADLQEVAFKPLYEAAFDAAEVKPQCNLLDVGCGAGLALRLALDRHAHVKGLDAAAALVAIAKSRLPGADIRVGELEELPFENMYFDVVTGFNSFQYATNRVHALQEAARVTRKGGKVIAAVWGAHADCEMGAYVEALGALLPAPPLGAPGPWALSPAGRLEDLMGQAGLQALGAQSVKTVFEFADREHAIRGLLASGVAVRAILHTDENTVADAVEKAIAPYRNHDGSFTLENVFRFVVAKN